MMGVTADGHRRDNFGATPVGEPLMILRFGHLPSR